MLVTASCIIAPKRKQRKCKCMPTGEQINTLLYSHKMKYLKQQKENYTQNLDESQTLSGTKEARNTIANIV